LIELNLEVARHFEEGNETVTMIFNVLGELNSPRLEFFHGQVDVITIKRNVCGAGWWFITLGWMNPEIGFWSVEDEPAAAYVASGQSYFIPQEGSKLLSL
jgi:hypothetical protein